LPNWPISDRARTYLRVRAIELSTRALHYAEADFPLTSTQIQYAVMPRDKVDTLRNYISQGTETIEKHTVLRLAFLRQCMPELHRGAVVNLTLPNRDWIVVDRATQYGMGVTKFSMDESSYLVPDWGLLNRAGEDGSHPDAQLSDEQRQDLVTWINRAIKQKRLHDMLKYTIANILDIDGHARTVGHLQAIWPMLCTLINNDPAATNPSWTNDRIFYDTWRDRFRAPRRNMGSYKPDPEVLKKFATFIRASDSVLAAGSILAPYTPDRKQIQASLVQWEKLPTTQE
jgi:hypothetical protein